MRINFLKLPVKKVAKITISSAKPIIAPKCLSYPEIIGQEQIEMAKKLYGFTK